MRKDKVKKAIGLFRKTECLPGLALNDPRFWKLFEMECQLFTQLAKMSEDELKTYRKEVKKLTLKD